MFCHLISLWIKKPNQNKLCQPVISNCAGRLTLRFMQFLLVILIPSKHAEWKCESSLGHISRDIPSELKWISKAKHDSFIYKSLSIILALPQSKQIEGNIREKWERERLEHCRMHLLDVDAMLKLNQNFSQFSPSLGTC